MKTLKKEEVYCSEYRDLADLTTHMEFFIDKSYNQQRLHSALRYTSPADFEAAAIVDSQVDKVTAAPKVSFFKA